MTSVHERRDISVELSNSNIHGMSSTSKATHNISLLTPRQHLDRELNPLYHPNTDHGHLGFTTRGWEGVEETRPLNPVPYCRGTDMSPSTRDVANDDGLHGKAAVEFREALSAYNIRALRRKQCSRRWVKAVKDREHLLRRRHSKDWSNTESMTGRVCLFCGAMVFLLIVIISFKLYIKHYMYI